MDFIKLIENILEEQGKSKSDLFDNNIISPNTFFKYKHRFPTLKTCIKLANYLEVSLDYLFELKNENLFTPYKLEEITFCNNLEMYLKSKNISGRTFCLNLGFSKDNILRWKKGVQPSIQSLLEIAKYFNCTIDELLL